MGGEGGVAFVSNVLASEQNRVFYDEAKVTAKFIPSLRELVARCTGTDRICTEIQNISILLLGRSRELEGNEA